jgi:hypothetical protein
LPDPASLSDPPDVPASPRFPLPPSLVDPPWLPAPPSWPEPPAPLFVPALPPFAPLEPLEPPAALVPPLPSSDASPSPQPGSAEAAATNANRPAETVKTAEKRVDRGMSWFLLLASLAERADRLLTRVGPK